jgi:multidrug efflux pump subunit AcrB
MGGIIGKLFREFAVTLERGHCGLLLVSLTTTPMMCAQFLKPHDPSRHGRIYRASERAFELAAESMLTGLRWVLRHQWLMLGVTIGTFV